MLHKKLQNLRHTWNGLKIVWQEEVSFKIQIWIGFATLLFGWLFQISSSQWLAITIVAGMVLTAETFNTALEEFCDMVKNDPDPHIAKIKDLAAAAVLISTLTAVAVGVIIFLPRILSFLS